MTVRQLQENMSASEFALWIAYFNECPPEYDDDYRAALICNSIFQSQGSKKSKIDMFMPQRKRKTKDDIWREQIAVMRGLGNANGRNSNGRT